MNKIFLLLLFFLAASAHDHAPYSNNELGAGLELRIFKKVKSWNLLLESSYGSRYEDKTYEKVKLGSYFKIGDGKKIGLFYSHNKGLRHTDDWIFRDGKWLWWDSSNRSESIYHFNYSQRFRSSALSPWVYQAKFEYDTNRFNSQSRYIVKPSAHYFKLVNGKPKWSLNFALPIYLPINFENRNAIYKLGLYTSYLWHTKRNYIFYFVHEVTQESWSDSVDAKIFEPDEPYSESEIINEFKFGLIFYL